MMDILMSETCWAHKRWNKIASDIKLVFHSSTQSVSFIVDLRSASVKGCHGGCRLCVQQNCRALMSDGRNTVYIRLTCLHKPVYLSRWKRLGYVVCEGDRGSNAGGAFRLLLGPSQPFTQWVTWTLSLLVERPRREAEQCFTFSVDLKKAWSYASTSPYTCFEPCGQGILIRCYNTIVITVVVNGIWKIRRCNNPYWAADSGPPLLEIPRPLWKSNIFYGVHKSSPRNLVPSQLNLVCTLRYQCLFCSCL